ncbi:MAG: serine/threonine protein phosphatase [Bacteroidetes bacterium]|nr:serine/threonine protein phosphatase [Bacteroidota bacterium]
MVAVIGDIHGCYNTLKLLFEEIKTRFPGVPIYSVGDLVDRGKFSFEVVEFIKENEIVFTAGNHDLMFYYFFTKPSHPIAKAWIYNGSETTMDSYSDHMDIVRDHLSFIIKAPLFLDLEDCFISHAGISSYYKKIFKTDILNTPAELTDLLNDELNSQHGIIWNRDVLLNLGKLQIVGHTIQQDVNYDEKSNALYIDTSAFTGNKLSAVVVEQNKLIDTISIETRKEDLTEQYK